MSGKFFLAGFLFFLLSAATAQRMSWRDIMQKLNKDRPQPDLRIPYGADSLHFGELWLPAGAGPHPVVVLIHGGCWLAALPGAELVAYAAQALKAQGFAVWNVEYRRVGHAGGGYPGTFQDVAKAADLLPALAPAHRLDLSRVIAAGHSAGGHLALWLALRKNIPNSSELYSATPLNIHAVVSLAGIGDLKFFEKAGAPACGDETISNLINKSLRKELGFLDTSPVDMGRTEAKFWLIQGVYDGAVPPYVGLNYMDKIKAKSQDSEFVLIQDAGHFEIIVPWSDVWETVASVFKKALKAK